jgi:uncharacterized membrane protein
MQQVNVVTFDDRFRAQEFLLAATRLAAENTITMQDAVFVTKEDDGRVHVFETTDVTPARGAASSGFWGLIFGTLLLGPVGGLAAGAITAGGGALLGKLIDYGIKDDFIAEVKQQIEPGRTALVLLTAEDDPPHLRTELDRFPGATMTTGAFSDEARRAVEEASNAGERHPDVATWPQLPTDTTPDDEPDTKADAAPEA